MCFYEIKYYAFLKNYWGETECVIIMTLLLLRLLQECNFRFLWILIFRSVHLVIFFRRVHLASYLFGMIIFY